MQFQELHSMSRVECLLKDIFSPPLGALQGDLFDMHSPWPFHFLFT